MFEKSQRSGDAPEDWKKANVTAVNKKGLKEDQGNHSPVSPFPEKEIPSQRKGILLLARRSQWKCLLGKAQLGFTQGQIVLDKPSVMK